MYLLLVGIPDVQAEIDTLIGTGDEHGGIICAASITAVDGGIVGQRPGLVTEYVCVAKGANVKIVDTY
ncbi:MAG: hypothetical protein JSS96_11485 [Bacteroidetes bacterium]|nr:hypothetical protein [Bacteroidota bacterium]